MNTHSHEVAARYGSSFYAAWLYLFLEITGRCLLGIALVVSPSKRWSAGFLVLPRLMVVSGFPESTATQCDWPL
ncbi:hypothetical protein EV356DRAFT_505388 [Viridothelium virens]|uniref:Uncharacterized protein n=1 Tax=Viridothelium virens TaxID=1048519 RepID=A0A6A6H3M3_VIRVR|nr:hypothetical protein EV356DRAFT_505388 [Viridothelium virens]